jgi:hypothetical protein
MNDEGGCLLAKVVMHARTAKKTDDTLAWGLSRPVIFVGEKGLGMCPVDLA